MQRTPLIIAASAACLVGLALAGQSTGQLQLKIKDLMTPSEFQAVGLPKLTPTELAALDRWLNRYTETVFDYAQKQAPAQGGGRASGRSGGTPDVVETCIDGEFTGWEGETIFKLCNGQIWQQAEYDYNYSYAYRPDVVIYRTAAGYRMKVEDEEDTILVTRIR